MVKDGGEEPGASTAPRTRSIGARKRKRRESGPVTSRYFSKVSNCSFRFSANFVSDAKIAERDEDQTLDYSLFPKNRKDNSLCVKGVTSNHFLRSPSSVRESVRLLGPLVYTWIGSSNCDEIRSNCLRRCSSLGSNGKPCRACSKVLREDAFRHFQRCPIFRQELDAHKKSARHSVHVVGQTCVEVVGRWAEEHALRHLCPHQCFLRAFAPSREWMMLRRNLKHQLPIGETLDDWTCRLVDETTSNEGEISALRTPSSICNEGKKVDVNPNVKHSLREQCFKGSLPRTLFVSLKTGEVRQNRAFFVALVHIFNHIAIRLSNTLPEFDIQLSSKSFPSFPKGRKYILKANDRQAIVNKKIFSDRKSKRSTFDESYYRATKSRAASPFGLVEELFPEDPWRVLICTMLLNKTKRTQNLDCILFHLFKRWPTADLVMTDANHDEESVHLFVFTLVRPAGLGNSKARAFVRLSRDYVDLLASKSQGTDNNEDCRVGKGIEFGLTRKEVKQLFNCGDYAADAYQIFIRKDFKSAILSNDDILLAYVEWKRSLSSVA